MKHLLAGTALIVIVGACREKPAGRDDAAERPSTQPLPATDRLAEGSVAQAARQAEIVVSGQLRNISSPFLDAPAQATYTLEIDVRRWIKGQGGTIVEYDAIFRTWPPEKADTIPTVGRDYIFFLSRAKGYPTLPFVGIEQTAENLRNVENALHGP